MKVKTGDIPLHESDGKGDASLSGIMSEDRDTIIEELRTELEKAKKREQEYAESRKAMLFMLEDLHESSQLIERAKKDWESTFDAIKDPVFIHDMDLNIVRANLAYVKYSEKSFKDIVGRPYYSIFPKMERPLASCLKFIQQEEEEEDINISSIKKTFKVRSFPVKDVEGRYIYSVHILEDITAVRDFEARLEDEVATTTDLLSIAEATSSVKDIDKLMLSIVKSTASILKTDICLGYERSHENKEFMPFHAEGLPSARLSLFRTRSLPETEWFVSEVINNKEILIAHPPFVNSAVITAKRFAAPDFFFAWLPGMGTMLVIPLSGRASVNGILILFYKDSKDFQEKDKKVIKGIMNQVSTALEEARLYRDSVDKAMDLSHKIETVRVMREIDRSVLSTLNPDEILETVVSLVSRLIPCDRATIAVADMERGGFIYKAGFGIDIPKGKFIEFSTTSASGLLSGGGVEFVPDISVEEALLPLEKRFLDNGYLSHMRVPITTKGEVTAVLSIGSRKAGIFKRDDLATLESLASQIGIALENTRLFTDLQELFLNIVTVLSNAIDAKSRWTRGHSERVTNYAIAIGKDIGFDDKTLENLRIAGLLHDIGKIGTYDVILDKPGRLDDDERKKVMEHPGRGAELLEPVKQFREIARWVKYHHEWYDGRGYPEGLKGEEIPLQARVLAVADTFDSMTAERPYRPTPGWDRALDELKKFSGTQFDPHVAEALIRVIKKAPLTSSPSP